MPSMHTMRWVLAAVVVVVAALAGSFIGAKRERATLADELIAHQSTLATLEKNHQEQLARVRTQRDVADASNKSLQEKLEQLQSQSLEQKSTQRLYEKIEGRDTSTGLDVDTITRVNDASGNPVELHITVVQARGRDRIKGQIGVALLGEKNESNWREVVVEVTDEDAPRFDMRFFQTLVVPLPDDDILIDIVEIDVQPDGNRHKSFRYEAEWSGILED